ncbi:hypothetical protein SAY86_030681 [Trapa natans]|uniref:Uncharacterized protein n=1 Tax=Trapa natans TaxID=22666 RepID=A0AAN7MN88_TRANT|nr:hypothetical protein SAY86_030681 [Trapa natans]
MARMLGVLAYLVILHVFVHFKMNSVEAGTRFVLFTRDQYEGDVPYVTITGDVSEEYCGRGIWKTLASLTILIFSSAGCNNNCETTCCNCDITRQPPLCILCCKDEP